MVTTTRLYIWGYAVFVLAALLLLIGKDHSTAFIFWALAPVFDPFDPQVKFAARSLWQRAWLFVHTIITLVLFCLLLYHTK